VSAKPLGLRPRVPSDLLLDVRGLSVAYPDRARQRRVRIVDDVSFTLRRGEALGLAGESGCGKTTTALSLLGLLPDGLERTQGTVELHSRRGTMHLHRRTPSGFRDLRWKTVSVVFQGAMNALDPVMRIGDQLAEAIRTHEPSVAKAEVRARMEELLSQVGVPARRARDYPHELSGGQRQRTMIALALACRPELVLADEPTTALDVMLQAQILELLEQLREQLGLSLLLISHDLAVLGETCDRIAVMYAGQIVEEGDVAAVYARPRHPYTRQLLGAFPTIGGPRELPVAIPGNPPDPGEKPSGCRFHPRCPLAREVCAREAPPVVELGDGHRARCHFARPEGIVAP
jgi:peptide/nickel transport system ATP-binding protein